MMSLITDKIKARCLRDIELWLSLNIILTDIQMTSSDYNAAYSKSTSNFFSPMNLDFSNLLNEASELSTWENNVYEALRQIPHDPIDTKPETILKLPISFIYRALEAHDYCDSKVNILKSWARHCKKNDTHIIPMWSRDYLGKLIRRKSPKSVTRSTMSFLQDDIAGVIYHKEFGRNKPNQHYWKSGAFRHIYAVLDQARCDVLKKWIAETKSNSAKSTEGNCVPHIQRQAEVLFKPLPSPYSDLTTLNASHFPSFDECREIWDAVAEPLPVSLAEVKTDLLAETEAAIVAAHSSQAPRQPLFQGRAKARKNGGKKKEQPAKVICLNQYRKKQRRKKRMKDKPPAKMKYFTFKIRVEAGEDHGRIFHFAGFSAWRMFKRADEFFKGEFNWRSDPDHDGVYRGYLKEERWLTMREDEFKLDLDSHPPNGPNLRLIK